MESRTLIMRQTKCYCTPAQFLHDENQWEPSVPCEYCIEERQVSEFAYQPIIYFTSLSSIAQEFGVERAVAVTDDLPF